jgi:hypothetical protein
MAVQVDLAYVLRESPSNTSSSTSALRQGAMCIHPSSNCMFVQRSIIHHSEFCTPSISLILNSRDWSTVLLYYNMALPSLPIGERESPIRWLAAGGGEEKELDYTVLAVAVTTLGLILAVELVRHKLDIQAVGRPFFKTVLGGVYRECESSQSLSFKSVIIKNGRWHVVDMTIPQSTSRCTTGSTLHSLTPTSISPCQKQTNETTNQWPPWESWNSSFS